MVSLFMVWFISNLKKCVMVVVRLVFLRIILVRMKKGMVSSGKDVILEEKFIFSIVMFRLK